MNITEHKSPQYKIDKNRQNHIFAVAEKMKLLAPKYNVNPEAAFIVGLLHDVGYAFTEDKSKHNIVGGMVLKDEGFKYWKEIYYHGIPQSEYQASMLMLLNFADMTTGPNGEEMTMQQRLDDIILRYGKDSIQAKNAIIMINILNNKN